MLEQLDPIVTTFHAPGRRTSLAEMLPHLGSNAEWIRSFAGAVAAMEPNPIPWDFRSGNAAIRDDGRLRRFYFEYAGLRYGPEDLAWLSADEIWPIAPDVMADSVKETFDPGSGHDNADYID